MTSPEIDKIINYLCTGFPPRFAINDMCKTYEVLSKDPRNKRSLVRSKRKALAFDLLSRNWIYKPLRLGEIPKSADAMTFIENQIIFIEFKTGDQDTDLYKRGELLSNVKGKIIDSDKTLHNHILSKILGLHQEMLEQNFFLVIDAGSIEEFAYVAPLIQLSEDSSLFKEEKAKKMLADLLGEFTAEDDELSHYKTIDIWYSELFDWYLDVHNIESLDLKKTY